MGRTKESYRRHLRSLMSKIERACFEAVGNNAEGFFYECEPASSLAKKQRMSLTASPLGFIRQNSTLKLPSAPLGKRSDRASNEIKIDNGGGGGGATPANVPTDSLSAEFETQRRNSQEDARVPPKSFATSLGSNI